jgi:hypothetical protein
MEEITNVYTIKDLADQCEMTIPEFVQMFDTSMIVMEELKRAVSKAIKELEEENPDKRVYHLEDLDEDGED